MSSADQEVSTGGGTGTGVQTIVKDKVKEMVEVRMACRPDDVAAAGRRP